MIHKLSGKHRIRRAVAAIQDWAKASPEQKRELLEAHQHAHKLRTAQRFGVAA